jgi:Protein of unknown function (DUF3307)
MKFLFLFLVGHAICDFVLQGEVMGSAKSRRSGFAAGRGPGFPPWYYWLAAHALTHGGAVFLIARSVPLAALETLLHAGIDHLKCEERISIHQDQALHVACKVLYVALAPWLGHE